jgi:O-antigen/teichoic acid export membrane protein
MIIFWFLARFLGPEIYGKFSYAHTIANTFLLVADFGFDLLLTTEIARNRTEAKSIFQKYFGIKIVLVLFSLLTMFIFVYSKSRNYESLLLGMAFGFYMLFNSITNFYFALFKGFERLDYEAKVSSVANAVLFIIAFVLLLLKQNVLLIAITYSITRLIGFVYSVKLASTLIPGLSYKIRFENFYEALKKTFVFGMIILSLSFLYQLDTIMLGFYKSDYELGIYQAVKYLVLVPLIFPSILTSALLPTFTRVNSESHENWISLNKTFFKIIYWISLPVAVLLYAFPEQIIEIIYSTKNYASAVPILRIYSFIIVFRYFADYLGVVLISSKRQNIQVYASIAGIVLSIILDILIIPDYGAYGAGVVMLIVTCFICSVFLLVNYKIYFPLLFNIKYIFMFGIAVITAVIAAYYNSVSIFIGGPAIALVFVLSAYLFFFSKEEIKSIFKWNLNIKIIK